MLRINIVAGVLFLGWLGLGMPTNAQLPLTPKQRMKKLRIKHQMKCMTRCDKRGYRNFYRCGPKGREYCKARAGVSFRACVLDCKAPWFCKGYKRVVRSRCTKLCISSRKKQQPRKRWRRRPSRRQFRRWARRFLRWQRRARYACKRVCVNYNRICKINAVVKLPPRTRLPAFKSKEREKSNKWK